jgi:hypothetical protein
MMKMTRAGEVAAFMKDDVSRRPRSRARRTNDPEGNRRDIVEVATQEFAEKGFNGARVDEIAAQTKRSARSWVAAAWLRYGCSKPIRLGPTIQTNERAMRSNDTSFAALLIIEALDDAALDHAGGTLRAAITPAGPLVHYDLVFALDRDDLHSS